MSQGAELALEAEEQQLMFSTTQQPSPAHLEDRAVLVAPVASPQGCQDKPFAQPCPAAASLLGPWGRRLTSICSMPGSLHGPGGSW